jgi:hypothetical protein
MMGTCGDFRWGKWLAKGFYSIRVEDDMAELVAESILGEDYEEIENPSTTMPHLRMFVREAG